MYKTISYPSHESGTGQIERLRLALNENDPEFAKWLSHLSSKELRFILQSSYSEIQNQSENEGIAVSQKTLDVLKSAYNGQSEKAPKQKNKIPQLALFDEESPLGKHGTFSPNHLESIHRWYPYLEGFSATFVKSLLSRWSPDAKKIYDPFAGTGTTMTVAATSGLEGYYSEINPFMRLVIEGKTKSLKRCAKNKKKLKNYFDDLMQYVAANPVSKKQAWEEFQKAFSDRPYFAEKRLIEILAIKTAIANVETPYPEFRNLANLALGGIAVGCSELKRAADLRYRTPKELLAEDFSVIECYKEKLFHISEDIDESLAEISDSICLSDNALILEKGVKDFDVVLTSPPYLNGTNYFRNTKIELWLTGLIESEKNLGKFTREAVTAGINNVSNNGRPLTKYDFVEDVAVQLDKVAYDRRIPELVRRYCSDAEIWLSNCYSYLRDGGRAIIDIGDSRFAGVHVPTDIFLEKIACKVGFTIREIELVRSRNSKDGTPLKQVLLILDKPHSKAASKKTFGIIKNKEDSFRDRAIEFEKELPHQQPPYSSRNWGHPLHSLCSYQGKLKPAIAHFLVSMFTEPGASVLDPMSGAGTIPLEALLLGRKPYANDIQELGYILSTAKVGVPDKAKTALEMDRLNQYISKNSGAEPKKTYADFGFNGKIPEYFEPQTLREILSAREYMKANACDSTERAIVYSSLLHILHGNRPYALSRCSHPVTPFKPTGDFEYRELKQRLNDKVTRALSSLESHEYINGTSTFGSFDDLDISNEIDTIITSPPFAASTRFYIANWMRLWMAGWEPENFDQKKDKFIENRQKKSFDVYEEFFEKSAQWLNDKGTLIMHVGKTPKHDMALELSNRCGKYFKIVYMFDESVEGGEKFGIRDQGATKAHQYIFLIKK